MPGNGLLQLMEVEAACCPGACVPESRAGRLRRLPDCLKKDWCVSMRAFWSASSFASSSGSLPGLLAVSLPTFLLLGMSVASPALSQAQLGPGMPQAGSTSNATALLTDPTVTPGVQFLFDLEKKFAEATAQGGGAAFSSWFAENAVSLSNGKPPVQGHDAIAAEARWDPRQYQLTWTPDGGEMGPGGLMGFTWGHYSGHSKDSQGAPIVTSGRYMTIWQKQADGSWKVELDASNDGPALDCCKLPQ